MAPKRKLSKSLKRKTFFMTIKDIPEGGLVVMPNEKRLYMCRPCQVTTNKPLKTEEQWFSHLQSALHQDKHRGFDLHRYIWDLDRTILINDVMGLQPNDLMKYLSQSGSTIVDFRYLAVKPGNTNTCAALLSSLSDAEQLTKAPFHCIGDRKFSIRPMHPEIKEKFLKARDDLLGRATTGVNFDAEGDEDTANGKKQRLE